MSKQHLVSILRPIADEIKVQLPTTSLLEMKRFVVTEVQKHTRMSPIDMQTIIRKTNEAPTGLKLQEYLWQSILKFEGEGVWQKQN